MREPSIDPSTLIMLDGAGVSRYNRVSPRHVTLLLGWLSTRLKLGPAFGAGLPTGQKGQVRAITGKMTGVTGMAGYATTKDDELLAFAILINGATKPLHDLEQEICAKLTQFSRKG
jgi:D-alanyl-D-alanine carboxypeptidase/D-alanyl-D-alanine-endopeptidase (penicillin-binding protein 4)